MFCCERKRAIKVLGKLPVDGAEKARGVAMGMRKGSRSGWRLSSLVESGSKLWQALAAACRSRAGLPFAILGFGSDNGVRNWGQ